LSGNQLRGRIPDSLGNLGLLTYLNVSRNSIQGVVPASLGSLGNLRVLGLGNNRLHGSLPEELSMLNKLSVLSASNTRLQGSMPSSLALLTSLSTLELPPRIMCPSGPCTSGSVASNAAFCRRCSAFCSVCPPFSLCNRTAWSLLQFQNDTGLPGTWTSDFAPVFDGVKVFSRSNRRHSCGVESIFIVGGNARSLSFQSLMSFSSSLTQLVLSNISHVGDIPADVGGLTRLKELDLSNNTLQGNVPVSFTALRNLTKLDLSSVPLKTPR